MRAAMLLALVAATPQIRDTLEFGDHIYSISEKPMLGLWDYSDEEIAAGKT